MPLPASVQPPKPSESEVAERAPPPATVIVPVPLEKRTAPVLVHVEPLPVTEIFPTAAPKYARLVSPATVTSAPFVTLIAPVPE